MLPSLLIPEVSARAPHCGGYKSYNYVMNYRHGKKKQKMFFPGLQCPLLWMQWKYHEPNYRHAFKMKCVSLSVSLYPSCHVFVLQDVCVKSDRLWSVMEPELNCSSQCDSPLCFIHSGVNRQQGIDILQRLCGLGTVITHTHIHRHTRVWTQMFKSPMQKHV